MDDDDAAVPPPIRRSPRAALECRIAVNAARAEDDAYDLDHEQATPVVPRSPSASVESPPSRLKRLHVNPLAAHPVNPEHATDTSPRKTAQSTMREWETLKPFAILPVPHRSPARLKSYRTNKRLPMHLRRQASLETINSVTTTHSIPSDEDEYDDEPDPSEASAPSPYFFTLERGGSTTPVPCDVFSLPSSMPSSSTSSNQSYDPPNTPTASIDRETQASTPTRTRFRMWSKSGGPLPVPDRLVIERTVSVDQISQRSSHSGSKSSHPSDRQYEAGPPGAKRSRSGTSSEWSASEFDASTLTEAELKKCKKKGINPSLFAEMKAARKGKW